MINQDICQWEVEWLMLNRKIGTTFYKLLQVSENMRNIFGCFTLVLLFWTVNTSSAMEIYPDATQEIGNIKLQKIPLFKGSITEDAVRISFSFPNGVQKSLSSIRVNHDDMSNPSFLDEIVANYVDSSGSEPVKTRMGSAKIKSPGKKIEIKTNVGAPRNSHDLSLDISLKENARLDQSILIESIELQFMDDHKIVIKSGDKFRLRPGLELRAAGQDNCDTYRIPGIITTKTGTLIAVYDNRYNNSKDLQEDVDVGISRSIDGGETWEPMKVIMDMGEYGGRPERLNGIGDPSILYDPFTHTIWVAALWISGLNENDMLWWASKPGMSPTETGQFMLVSSTDDGQTWSDPINITEQIKDPSWQLLFQGPGMGITMNDGTLVFPAQFKADIGQKAIDGGQYTSHSTIVYSKDGGKSWSIGTGAKPNTTEAQVVQLADGSLMLNMRDDLNRQNKGEGNGRAVSVTHDMGQTWTVHPTNNSALQEPNCMASLIATDLTVKRKKQQILFFSNPNNKNARTNMTIKASLDSGQTWPENMQTELYAPAGFGYSCLTLVDGQTIGIVYEGTRNLIFQKIPVSEITGIMK